MIVHEQRSDRSRTWFDSTVTEVGGNLVIDVASFWLHGRSYNLPALNEPIGTDPFRLCIEKTITGADYALDFTGYGTPLSFGEGIGAILVAWREEFGGEVHVLRSVKNG